MEYKEKFLDPRWQKKRIEILQRDDFTCKRCQKKDKTLHVHHLYYIANTEPWDYPDKAFKTLCNSCHEREAIEMPKKLKELSQAIKMQGLLSDNLDPIIRGFKNMNTNESGWIQAFVIESLLTNKRTFNIEVKKETAQSNCF